MKFLPSFANSLWAINSAILLVFAFPDYDFWFLAFFALIPFFYALEKEKESKAKSFVLGWIWGITFFFGTCWWLSYPMIHTAGIPTVIAYGIVLCVTIIAGLFPALFGLIQSILLKRFGTWVILLAPFVWVFTEFLRYWLTGDNWNAIGYSQAFASITINNYAQIGGILLMSFIVAIVNTSYFLFLTNLVLAIKNKPNLFSFSILFFIIPQLVLLGATFLNTPKPFDQIEYEAKRKTEVNVIAIQPNVPMNGLNLPQWKSLRERHVELAENAIKQIPQSAIHNPQLVVFPESPMNFEYAKNSEMREFFKDFTTRNNVKILFNSAEPVYPAYLHKEPWTLRPEEIEKSLEYYNSAVLVNEKGEFEQQYDKIHLLPFGEFMPLPKSLSQYIPPVVGNFTHGKEYDIFNFGEVKAGLMICFESHFPSLSREYANKDADVIIEMTNDGYLGNTPVLRQHLANAVFRAVETNRPLVRVTNVGITAFIDEKGKVIEPTEGFTEDTRIWTISKSDGEKTFYVKYGDWIAWLCSFVTLVALFLSRKKTKSDT